MNPYQAYLQTEIKNAARTKYEDLLFSQIKGLGYKEPVREFKFHPDRKWRFDFAYPEEKVAIEVEGGIWSGGRHTRGTGFEGDCEKYNAAALAGWRVFRFTTGMVTAGNAITILGRLLA